MALLNPNLKNHQKPYLFSHIAEEVKKCSSTELINLGIGDISLPLPSSAATALAEAAQEMQNRPIGYGPATGYPFLKEAIQASSSTYTDLEEIFIADGICPDLSDISELFDASNVAAIPNPSYPLYRDLNEMAGRTILELPLTEENDWKPRPPESHVDLIYLCSPHNPTGSVLTRDDLTEWVHYARESKAILFFDAAYHAFAKDPSIPGSIYEIEGAREVAIEYFSFSKAAGFTGLRCSSCLVPKTLAGSDEIHKLWTRRQQTKTNGVSYPIQRAAAATLTPSGQAEVEQQIRTYQTSTRMLKEALETRGFQVWGGKHSPYLWWKTPISSWEFFRFLLHEHGLVVIPGTGFGSYGEGFVRISGLIPEKQASKAIQIINRLEAFSYAH